MNPDNSGAAPTPAADPAVPAGGAPTSDNGLSMDDSLASAADSLTSAGMATTDTTGGAVDLEKMSDEESAAAMARPDEPLIPAAPVPGSLGSAISGPTVADNAMDAPGAAAADPAVAATGADASALGAPTAPAADVPGAQSPVDMGAPVAPVPGAGPAPVPPIAPTPAAPGAAPMTPGAAPAAPGMPTPNAMPGAAPAGPAPVGPAGAAPAGMPTPPDRAPYNPFTAPRPINPANPTMPNVASSMNVPMGLQPKKEAFSKPGMGGKKSPLTLILGLVAALCAAAAVLFCILWLTKDGERIVYVPSVPAEGEVNPDVVETGLSCILSEGVGPVENLNGATNTYRQVRLTFKNDVLSSVSSQDVYNFENLELAQASLPAFEAHTAALNEQLTGAGLETLQINVQTDDRGYPMVGYEIKAEDDQMIRPVIWNVNYPTNDTEQPLSTRSDVKTGYEAKGYVCRTSEEIAEQQQQQEQQEQQEQPAE